MSDDAKIIVENTDSWEERFEEGRSYLEEGNIEEALSILGALYQSMPEEKSVRILLAMALSHAERWIDAEALYLKLIEDYPREILLRIRLATLYIQLERHVEAREWLEATLEIEPNSQELHRILAMLYLRLGEYSLAKHTIELADDDELRQLLHIMLQEVGISEDELTDQHELSQNNLTEKESVEDSFSTGHELDFLDSTPEDLQSPSEEEVSFIREEINSSSGGHELDFIPEEEYEEPTQEISIRGSVDGALPVVVIPPTEESETEKELQSEEYVREDYPFAVEHGSFSIPKEKRITNPLGLMRGEGSTPLWLDLPQLFDESEQEFVLLNDGRLLVQVLADKKVYLRLRDLVLLSGSPELNVESKRFQGNPVEQVFGPRRNPVVRIDGKCQLLLQAQKEGYRSSVVLADEETAYFREGSILGFSSDIEWENGRVPSSLKNVEDLALDQFWGRGELILESKGPIWGIPANEGQRVRVEYSKLVGWVGSLIPHIVSGDTISSSVKSKIFIDFEGNGGVLISS